MVVALTARQWNALVDVTGITDACHSIEQVRQLVTEDPRCSTVNPLFAEVEHPGVGTYLMPGSPLDFSTVSRVPVRRAPLVGEHTDEVLAQVLGLSSHEIARLHDQGIVAGLAPEAVTR